MSNVRISHQKAVATYDSLTSRSSTSIDRDTFSYHRMISDDSETFFPNKLQVLRNTCDDCTWMDMAVLAQTRTTFDDSMTFNDTSFSYLSILFDDSEGMDNNPFTNLSIRMNAGQRTYISM